MARPKNCWEWITSKIESKEKKLKNSNKVILTFFVFKDGKVSYCIGTANPNKSCSTNDYPISYKGYQILCCKEKAEEVGLKCDVTEQYSDNPVMIITFTKEI